MTVLHPDPDSGFIVIDPPPADGLVLASGLMRLACRAVADAAVWVRLLVDHLDGAKQALQGRH